MKPNYRLRATMGWLAILLISCIPVFLWFNLGPGFEDFSNYSDATHALGELFGLVGMTMFALTFVLSTRIKAIEDIFGGLDKVYIAHGILGGAALILILAHPIFLVIKFVPRQINKASEYLLPSSNWSVNFGIIALLGMIILIYITLYTKIKYPRWKFTHEFFGAMFFLAILHIFLVRDTISADNIFNGYYYYASAVSFIGLASFSYSLFLKNRIIKNAIYKVKEIKKSKDVFILELTPEHKPIKYKSGQFVFLRFYNNKLSREAHPFSIASKTDSEIMRIVIKKLGDFTGTLDDLKINDKISIEGPYGRFHYQNYGGEGQIWIGSGIGITPFIGMAEDICHEKDSDVQLYFTAKEESELIGYEFFANIAAKNRNFKFFPWPSNQKGRINAEVIANLNKDLKKKNFLLCGPPKFKESIINQLVEKGVKKDHIHEEAFEFR